MDAKKEVHSLISQRVSNITKASRALLLMRFTHAEEIADEGLNVGEGAFLIGSGAFSTFEYLSIIYYGLTNSVDKWFDCKKPLVFKVRADDCFANLILNNKSGVKLGIESLSPDELKNFWSTWRNKLAHLLCHNYKNTSLVIDPKLKTRSSYLDFINSKTYNVVAFSRNETGGWDCLVDVLNRELDKVAGWIAKDVLEKADKDNIEKIFQWLEENFK